MTQKSIIEERKDNELKNRSRCISEKEREIQRNEKQKQKTYKILEQKIISERQRRNKRGKDKR